MRIKQCLAMAVCILLVVLVGTSMAADTVKLRFTCYFPNGSILANTWAEYCKQIEKRSNGRVDITYYPGGTIMSGPATTDGIKTGVADMGLMTIGHVSGRFPVSEAIMNMIGFSSAYITGHVSNDFYQKFKPKEWDDFKVLVPGGNSAFVLFAKKPVNSLADMKGLRVRAPGNTGKQAQMLGAAPVSMPMGDTFDSLSKGVLDGCLIATEAAKTWRLAEACPYLIQTWPVISPACYVTIMNKKSWDGLPADVKATIEQVSAEWVEKAALAWNEMDMVSWEHCKKLNIKVIDLAPEEIVKWKKAMAPMRAEYTKRMVGLGYSEAEVNSWFDYMDERIDYWLKKQIESGIKSPVGPSEIRS